MSTADSSDKPTVLIVGAGLGGLMLGALLEKSNQLGIYEEFIALGKYLTHIPSFGESNENLYPKRPTDFRPIEEFTGYGQYIVARPKLYELLYRQVPSHKIHLGKRVLNVTEQEDRVIIHTADNGTYEGDILVGADGAYSAVRQRLYDRLRNEGKLPKGDQEELPFSCTCLVGQTRVLDPKAFPFLEEEKCQVVSVLSDNKPFTLDKTTSKAALEQRFRNSENSGEWGAVPAQTMCEETQGFPIPLNGEMKTMGDIYALTPKEFVSKVMREEKVFETWYSGRVVLLGDACHKLNPSGGHGAVTALHDAIALANLLYAMPTSTSADITNIFQEYQKERYPAVMESYNNSRFVAKVSDRGIIGRIILYLITHMPMWLWRLAQMEHSSEKPTVLIVGAGLGGLMLGVLLEKQGVPYTIFERASSVKPLGSGMAVGPTLLPIFQQLDIYEEFLPLGKRIVLTPFHKESLESYRPIDHIAIEEFTGYSQYLVARPDLYALILKQVPPHKIHFGKRVLNITEEDDKVT
ncbi:hypothetical protein BGZ97_003324, partial [Linnemannia gamsii]